MVFWICTLSLHKIVGDLGPEYIAQADMKLLVSTGNAVLPFQGARYVVRYVDTPYNTLPHMVLNLDPRIDLRRSISTPSDILHQLSLHMLSRRL